jgi:hypothetical protein
MYNYLHPLPRSLHTPTSVSCWHTHTHAHFSSLAHRQNRPRPFHNITNRFSPSNPHLTLDLLIQFIHVYYTRTVRIYSSIGHPRFTLTLLTVAYYTSDRHHHRMRFASLLPLLHISLAIPPCFLIVIYLVNTNDSDATKISWQYEVFLFLVSRAHLPIVISKRRKEMKKKFIMRSLEVFRSPSTAQRFGNLGGFNLFFSSDGRVAIRIFVVFKFLFEFSYIYRHSCSCASFLSAAWY